MILNCALDGPGGAGKSTIAREVAKRLGIVYVDTGALYRTLALNCLRKGIEISSEDRVIESLADANVELSYLDGAQRVLLNGEDVSLQIRTAEISMAASSVSAIPKVREHLIDVQRDIAAKNSCIMDGRDIGTVILPNADVKIFLTASPEERARRRYKELCERNEAADYEVVLREINERDYNDSHRKTAPLRQAEDAVLIDTSGMGIEEAVESVISVIRGKTDFFQMSP